MLFWERNVSFSVDENSRQPSRSKQVTESIANLLHRISSFEVKSISSRYSQNSLLKMTRSLDNLNVIFACTLQIGIGLCQDLPFRIKKDMKYFSKLTSTPNSAVVMGRKTWDSIPTKFRPLKDRVNIVLSKSMGKQQDCLVFDNLNDALDRAADMNVWIMGGAEIYNQSCGMAEKVFITRVERVDGVEIECDTFLDLSKLDLLYYKLDDDAVVKILGEDALLGRHTEGQYQFEFQIWQRK